MLKPFLWLICLIVTLTVVLQLTSIKKVEVKGASASNSDQITQSVNIGLRKQWFGGNMLLVNTGGLTDFILKAQPIVEEVKVERKLSRTLVVSVNERQQGIRWKSGEQIFLLDTKGTVIGESSTIHEHLPLVSDSTNLPVKQGDRVVSRSFVLFCTSIHAGLPPLDIKFKEMIIPETSSELHIKTEKGYVIKLDTARPAGETLEDLKKINIFLVKNKKVPAEYIDLRITGKAYYR